MSSILVYIKAACDTSNKILAVPEVQQSEKQKAQCEMQNTKCEMR